MNRFETAYMTILKISGSIMYSFFAVLLVVQTHDSYELVFSDLFFWAAAFLGTSLMLLVERADPKVKTNVTPRRIFFSIAACLSIVFIAGTVRASMIEDTDFERNHWFYGIVMFLCAIAPELIRIIIIGSPKAIGDGFNEGIKNRTKKWIGGNDTPNDEPLKENENE